MQVSEMFYSVQGEGHGAGEAAVFVRFAGCNLNCEFCDTPQRLDKGTTLSACEIANNIYDAVLDYPGAAINAYPTIVLTGGEPFAQPLDELYALYRQINSVFYKPSIIIETNGTLISPTDDLLNRGYGCTIVVSPKTPDVFDRSWLINSKRVRFKFLVRSNGRFFPSMNPKEVSTILRYHNTWAYVQPIRYPAPAYLVERGCKTDSGRNARTFAKTLELVKNHPREFVFSMQMHKTVKFWR